MTNKPKAIGTAAETAVRKALLPYFPEAERLVLAGAQDQGDIGHCNDFIFEVKGGAQTKQIGDALLKEWLTETEVERQNRGVQYGVLVTQRHGFGAPRADRWWAYVLVEDFADWVVGGYVPRHPLTSIRLELGTLLDMLADLGYAPDATA